VDVLENRDCIYGRVESPPILDKPRAEAVAKPEGFNVKSRREEAPNPLWICRSIGDNLRQGAPVIPPPQLSIISFSFCCDIRLASTYMVVILEVTSYLTTFYSLMFLRASCLCLVVLPCFSE
jgi:hypothetical protein